MKAVILAGGLGTRLSEETVLRPKPMVEIGGKPILWHIMKGYAHFGITDFVICLGYKGYMVKEYFANLALHTSDVSIDLARNKVALHQSSPEPWNITLIDTGEHTQTGGRLRRIRRFVDDDIFCMTYGDGVADIDIAALTKFHHAEKCLATVTAVRPAARFGRLDLDGHRARGFQEKPRGDGDWIDRFRRKQDGAQLLQRNPRRQSATHCQCRGPAQRDGDVIDPGGQICQGTVRKRRPA